MPYAKMPNNSATPTAAMASVISGGTNVTERPSRAMNADFVVYAKSAFIALLGLSVTFVPPEMTLAIAAVGVALLFGIFAYGIRWLDYHEFLEAGASFASAMRKARGIIQDRILA